MAKRTATTELNHDNWEDEDKPEEAGTFKRATTEEMKSRVIKTARRRGVGPEEEAGTKSTFASFTGFANQKKADSGAPPAASKGLFSFLSSNANGSRADAPSSCGESGASKPNGVDETVTDKSNSDKEYYRKLKGLNESVSKWISSHVASNPLCILTPVFKDYEKHLTNIQSAHCKGSNNASENLNQETHEKFVSTKIKENTEETGASESDKLKAKETSGDKESEKLSKSCLEASITSKASSETAFTGTGSIFGTAADTTSTASATFSFGSSSVTQPQASLFSFGTSSATSPPSNPSFSFGAGSSTSPSAGFSFGGTGKPYTFNNVAKLDTGEDEKKEEDDDEEPPKPDHKPVTEEGTTYTKRCKVFVKKGTEYSDRGVGNLFLKPVDGGKTQLIVRADTSLGNLLLNVVLSSGLPTQRLGSNNVAIVCIPTPDAKPPPVTVLLRVKTSSDADELLEVLEKHKK